MKAKLAVLAEYAGISKDNRLNILGIFEDISVRAFPATMPHLYAVLSCQAEPTEYGRNLPIRVAFLDEDGNEILALEALTQVARPKHPSDRVIVNQIAVLSFVQFRHPGNYRFLFSVEGEEIASIPLRADKVD